MNGVEDRTRLGNMLVEAGMLTPEQLRMAIDFQKSVGGKLGAIITKLGFIEDQTLTQFIARQQGIPVVNLEELVLPENLVRKIPRKLIERHYVLPIHFHDGVLTVATSDPFDFEALEELQLALDYRIEIQLAPRSHILKCIHALFQKDAVRVAPKEKGREELVRELDGERPEPDRVSPLLLREALIPLLIEKGIITEEELQRKARELEAAEGASPPVRK